MADEKPKKPLEKQPGHSLLIIRLIALDKFVKGSLLVFVGVFMLHMLHLDKNIHDTLHSLVNALKLDENNHWIHIALEKSLGLRRGTLRALSVGTFIYAGLYFIEGTGLFLDQGWAEWLTVISTAGFVPVEIYEICREATLLRIGALVLNILIVVYISLRLRWRHQARLHARAHGATLIIPRHTRPTGIKP